MGGGMAAILAKRHDMQRAAGAAEKVQSFLEEIDATASTSEAMQSALTGEGEERAAALKAGAALSIGEAKREVLERVHKVEAHLNNLRAFRTEAQGDKAVQIAFRRPTTPTSSSRTRGSR